MSNDSAPLDDIRPSRRSFLFGTLIGAASLALPPRRSWAASSAYLSGVKALTFDMQGTVFDFYDPISAKAKAIGEGLGLARDWAATLAGDWSSAAHDIIVEISAQRRPWVPNTEVYREALGPLLAKRGVQDILTDSHREELLSVWGQMIPWRDAQAGLAQLRQKYTLATLTNASMSQMTALVKGNGLPFDEILTGELNKAFKPDPRVYRLAVDYTGFRADQLLMVSAHKWDLQASRKAGFRTAYIPRPLELGPGHAADTTPEEFIDVVATDLIDLANQLRA